MIEYSNVKSNGISGLAFIQNNQVIPSSYTKINQDLTKGAGGTFNYLCISKSGKSTITEIIIMWARMFDYAILFDFCNF